MPTIQEKIQSFLTFYQSQTGCSLTLAAGKEMPGTDGVWKSREGGGMLALKFKRRIFSEDIGLFQAVLKEVSLHKCSLVILTDGLSHATAQALRDVRLNFYVSPEDAAMSLPGFIYVYHLVQALKKKARTPTAHSVFAGRGARLCRWLLADRTRQWHQNELTMASGLNKGYVSILMRRMQEMEYVLKCGRSYQVEDFNRLLDDWEKSYVFQRFVEKRQYAVAGRDYRQCVENTALALRTQKCHFAFTGWTSAALCAPYMEPPLVMGYVSVLPENAPGLYPVEEGGNVFLAVPSDAGRFQAGKIVDGLPIVSDVQAYLDLKKMPGRAGDQAEHFRDKLLK